MRHESIRLSVSRLKAVVTIQDLKCYIKDCNEKPEWFIFVDDEGNVCCDIHAGPIGSYVVPL